MKIGVEDQVSNKKDVVDDGLQMDWMIYCRTQNCHVGEG